MLLVKDDNYTFFIRATEEARAHAYAVLRQLGVEV